MQSAAEQAPTHQGAPAGGLTSHPGSLRPTEIPEGPEIDHRPGIERLAPVTQLEKRQVHDPFDDRAIVLAGRDRHLASALASSHGRLRALKEWMLDGGCDDLNRGGELRLAGTEQASVQHREVAEVEVSVQRDGSKHRVDQRAEAGAGRPVRRRG